MFTRKIIMQKTFQVALSTLLSRFLGIIREILTVRYLGASALSDAFFTAFKVPNSLRKIFAEGALSAVFVPSIVQSVRIGGHGAISSMMSLGFLVFESMVLMLCGIGIYYAHSIIALIAPGFSIEQVIQGALFLKILMPFIFFISTSALLAGPLQAVNHFFIPSFGPVLLNIVYIFGLGVCLYFSSPVTTFCWFILAGGFIQLVAHVIMFWKLHFRFGVITWVDVTRFGGILGKFMLCLLSMSVMEIGLFIDTSFGSLLAKGSVSLINYANRFMGIPLGVFAVAFSTILLPYFSRISTYAPKRLGFYILEATKLVWWVTIPVALMMMMLSHKIFNTIFLSEKFTQVHVQEASVILIAFLVGLFFFAINKILSNAFYALHNTFIPGVIAVLSLVCNVCLNWLFLDIWQATGLAFATSISGLIQTVCLFIMLHYYFKLPLYIYDFYQFAIRHLLQMILFGLPFILFYYSICFVLNHWIHCLQYFLCQTIIFWFWVIPLCCIFMAILYYTRNLFGIRMLFLQKE